MKDRRPCVTGTSCKGVRELVRFSSTPVVVCIIILYIIKIPSRLWVESIFYTYMQLTIQVTSSRDAAADIACAIDVTMACDCRIKPWQNLQKNTA